MNKSISRSDIIETLANKFHLEHKTSEMAIGLMPIILIPMVVLGGMMTPVHEMGSAAKTLTHVIPTRWCFEAMLLVEAEEQPKNSFGIFGNALKDDSEQDDVAQRFFPNSRRHGTAKCVFVLVVMLASLVVAISMVLKARDVH